MRRFFRVRPRLLFTSLRLDSVLLPVPGTIFYSCAVRSLTHSSTGLARRNRFASIIPIFTPSQIGGANMSTSVEDAKAQEVIDRLKEPANKEADILEKNDGRDEALNVIRTGEKKVANNEGWEEDNKKEKKEEALPKLSAADFRVYNSMAEHMEYFHNHFRQSWTLLHTACTTNQRPRNLSLRQFLQTGLSFISQLEVHHGIEEQHIFPVLARKMPEFKSGKNAAELLRQHKEIHKGMDIMQEYLEKCKNGEVELSLRTLGEKMDTFGEVLWTHLDQEVKTLGAENMRRYWSKEEMGRMPM
ncbi:hypothetical protein MFRU_027g00720 [Monilinia fructicola]|nr:hypothetical protein MFRU_027g00720 [Monilinia fructicola]